MEDIPNYVLYIILFILLIIVLLFVLKYKFNWSFKISIGRKDAEVIKSDEVNNKPNKYPCKVTFLNLNAPKYDVELQFDYDVEEEIRYNKEINNRLMDIFQQYKNLI